MNQTRSSMLSLSVNCHLDKLFDDLDPSSDVGLGDDLGDDPHHLRVDQLLELGQVGRPELGLQLEDLVDVLSGL